MIYLRLLGRFINYKGVGPRESNFCPVYDHAYGFLKTLLQLKQQCLDVTEPTAFYNVLPKLRMAA
jgi:hypothetical protein